jgi:phenylacetate-CoA ligase
MALPSRAASRAGPEIRARQERHFGALLRRVLQSNDFYRGKYEEAEVSLSRPIGLSDCRELPFTERSELVADQERHPPLGSNLTFPVSRYTRIHRTEAGSGTPLAWADSAESWDWCLRCWMAVLEAGGVSADDRIAVFSSFGPRLEPWAALEAGQRLGALAVPGDATEPGEPLAWLGELEPTVIVCRPQELQILGESSLSPSRVILLTDGSNQTLAESEAGAPSGWTILPAAGSAEIGTWGYTCLEGGALHANEAEFVAEIIDPRTDQPAEAEGKVPRRGELVLTGLGREASPLIRYRTGVRVALAGRACACGGETAVLTLPKASPDPA